MFFRTDRVNFSAVILLKDPLLVTCKCGTLWAKDATKDCVKVNLARWFEAREQTAFLTTPMVERVQVF